MSFRTVCNILALVLVLALRNASATSITFLGPVSQQGTGFGTTDNLLVLHNSPNESGSVLRSGGADVTSGDASSQSSTQTAGTVQTNGGTTQGFLFIFQVNQTGQNSPLNLNNMSLVFTNSDGSVTLFTANFIDDTTNDNGPNADPWDALNGVGVGSSGYLFQVNFTGTDGTTFFSNLANRVGQEVTIANQISGSDDGPDSFFLAQGAPVPEPGSLVLLGSGLAGLGAWRRRRSKTTRA